jgi:hypothetical protein
VQLHIQIAVSQQEVVQLLRDQSVDLMIINWSFAEVTFTFRGLTFMPTPSSSSSSKTPHWPCEQGAKNASHNREGSNNDVHFGICWEVAAEESCEKNEQLEKPFAMYRLNWILAHLIFGQRGDGWINVVWPKSCLGINYFDISILKRQL